MGFANLSDDIVNMYSTCLVCKHPSIVCDRSIEDVEEANRVARERNEAENLNIGTNNKQGSASKKRKVALEDTSVMFSCSCLSMHCYQQPNGGTCHVCRDLGDRRSIDKEGQCVCPICKCRCYESYSSTDFNKMAAQNMQDTIPAPAISIPSASSIVRGVIGKAAQVALLSGAGTDIDRVSALAAPNVGYFIAEESTGETFQMQQALGNPSP
jgi:hypothetical protein